MGLPRSLWGVARATRRSARPQRPGEVAQCYKPPMRAARPRALFALATAVHSVFAALIFARLGQPLLWEDEAETAMHGRNVLEYGVPKMHVGRNIVYGAPLPLALGRNEALDAYVGSPWGQYFFAAPAVAWSEGARDLAARTWRMRLPFALAGRLGVLLLGSVGAGLWPAAAGPRAAFWRRFRGRAADRRAVPASRAEPGALRDLHRAEQFVFAPARVRGTLSAAFRVRGAGPRRRRRTRARAPPGRKLRAANRRRAKAIRRGHQRTARGVRRLRSRARPRRDLVGGGRVHAAVLLV